MLPALVVALAILIAWLKLNKDPQKYETATCPFAKYPSDQLFTYEGEKLSLENNFECFFAPDYASARKLFLESANRIGAVHKEFKVMDGLYTDVAIVEGNPENVLLHISGTHGVEAYAGSAIQSALLHHLAVSPKDPTRPTIVFVHALNPFGFANNRRVNEDGVDLNRNFLTPEQFDFVKKRDPNFAGYVDVDFVINPKEFPFKNTFLNDVYGIGLTAYAALAHGANSLKKSLVSGNYYKNTGLGFGGFELTQSSKNLISIVTELEAITRSQRAVLLDVHTGLGPLGVDSLAFQTSMDLSTFYKTEFDNSGKPLGGLLTSIKAAEQDSALSGYELTVGTVTEEFCETWFLPQLKDDNKLCVTQEFGTIDMMLVGKALVDENCAFHNANMDAESKDLYGKRLKSSFFIDSKFWKRNVVKRGLSVISESIDFLNTKK